MYALWQDKPHRAVLLEKVRAPTRPGRRGARNDEDRHAAAAAVVAAHLLHDAESEEDTDFVCMMANGQMDPGLTADKRRTVWHIDSAATAHMTFDRSAFATYQPVSPFAVQMGDSSTSLAVGRGDVYLSILSDGKTAKCKLRNVLHVPSFVYSLVSVTALAKRGLIVQFQDNCATIIQDGKSVASGTRVGGLYTLDLSTSSEKSETALTTASLQLWHERMCHVHQAGVLNMARNKVVSSMEITSNKQGSKVCEACIAGKMHRSPIPRASETRAAGLLDLIHTDVAGPLSVPSKGGALYFVTFIDDKSRWLTVFPIKSKSDCFSCFLKFRSGVETQTGRKIKAIRSDGGGEYLSNEFKGFMTQNGIHHQQTCAYTPQQNGVAERMNRTLKDLVRAMLFHRNVPEEFWAEALCTAAYIRNRVTTKSLPKNKTPFHIWLEKVPDVSHLRVFGSRCWYKINQPNLRSLDVRAREAMMLGYATNQKAYKLWDLSKGEVAVSRDVVFEEGTPALQNTETRSTIDIDDDPSYSTESECEDSNSANEHNDEEDHLSIGENTPGTHTPPDEETDEDDGAYTTPSGKRITPAKVIAGARRSTRERRAPSEWWKASALASVVPEDQLTFSAATKGRITSL